MKQYFNLTLDISNDKVSTIQTHKIKDATSLLELMAKFNLLVLQIQNELSDKELEELKKRLYPNDDNIPF